MSHPHEGNPELPDLDALSDQAIAQLAADCLSRLDIGRQPLPLFRELSRLAVLSTVEVVPLYEAENGETHVLLGQRPASDLWWPDLWHVPGSVLLPTDPIEDLHDYETPVQRIIRQEFGDAVSLTAPPRVFDAQRRGGPRGHEQTVFTWAKVIPVEDATLPANTRFFNVEQLSEELPEEAMVAGHHQTVHDAVADYSRK